MTEPELRLVADLGTAFYFCAAGPRAPATLSAGFFALTGMAQPPSPGCHWTEAIHPDDRTSFVGCWARAEADRARIDTEVRLIGTDGRDHHYRVRASPLLLPGSEGDGPLEWVGVALDASGVSATTAQLTTEFLATASHELRTPIGRAHV